MSTARNDVSDGLKSELPALWRFALKLTASEDDAADLVQRTCVKALEQRHTFTPTGKLRSWLFSIEHRIWLNELRSRQVRRHSSLAALQDSDLDAGGEDAQLIDNIRIDQPEGNTLFLQIVTAVNTLPEAQRLAMLLVNVEGFTYSEAAEILDIPIGTVMSRISRARQTIGSQLLSSGRKADNSTTASGTGISL